jgi:hypothetical protein
MSEITFSDKPIDLKAVKRPKAYNTFTSLKGTSGIYIQKGPVYSDVKNGARQVLSEAITASVQRNAEFDCYALFLGSADGKVPPNPTFVKLATKGFKSEGKTVYIGPEYLQQVLETQVSSSTNRILLWRDRPRSAAEKALEKALEEKTVKILANEEEIGRLRALLTTHKIQIPPTKES